MVQTRTAESGATRASSPSRPRTAGRRGAARTWIIRAATFIGFALPAIAYLWMIHSYGGNVIFADQWDDITLIGHAYSGTLHFSTLWAQHYENRIFFPNLIVLALAYTTHLNVLAEEYLSALMAFGATALLILAHKRRSPDRRWIWYCPVAFLLLSLAQAPNALWGFQMAWYLVLLMIALALFLLDRPAQNLVILGGAIAAGVVASFSSLQGLLVWPAGLLLIYLRRRPKSEALIWVAAAAATTTTYLVGFNFNVSQSSGPSGLHHPVTALTFLLRVIGDILGDSRPGAWEVLFGALLLTTSIWSLVRFGRRRSTMGGRPIGLALVVFAFLFAILTAYGRSSLNAVFGNVEQRYTVFAVLMLLGLYLVVLDPLTPSEEGAPPISEGPTRTTRLVARSSGAWPFAVARAFVGIAVVLTVFVGTINGLDSARAIRDNRNHLGQIVVRVNRYPNSLVQTLDWLETPASIRRRTSVAERLQLSLFGTDDAKRYLQMKPIDLYASPLRARIALPPQGSTLRGRVLLDVFVSDQFDIKRIEYQLSGGGLVQTFAPPETNSTYGWLSGWDTTTSPNGRYTLEGVVTDSGGRVVRTSPIEVKLDNR